MKVFTQTNNFLTKNRKNIIYILWFLVVFFVLSNLTFAWWLSTTVNPEDVKNKSIIISWLNEVLKAVAVTLTLWTNIVWWFLSPEWTSGKIIWIDGVLKSIWIMVSNVVYFLFAWIFIWIAFMNIIGKDGETYQLKQAIPRFIVWVLIVPFSWFFVQFIISLSNILTAAVLSLPMTDEIYKKWDLVKKELMIEVCTEWYTINTWTDDALKKLTSWQKVSSSGKWYVIVCNSPKQEPLSKVLAWNKIYSVMYFYTFTVMEFKDYWKLFSWDLVKWLEDIIAVIFKTWFSIIFIIIYAILVITLWIALFVRVIWFWIFAMLSPIFWLFYFFKKDGWWEWAAKYLSVKNLIWLWLVPVYVSAALAFWIIFILTADKWIETSWLIKKSCMEWVPWTNNQYTKVCWDWVYHWENKTSSDNTFKWFVGNFWKFLLQVFGILFLWMWVMAALKSSDITKEVASPIAEFWARIWDIMRKAPTYTPIFPWWLSAQGMQQVWQAANTYFLQKSIDTWKNFMEKHRLFSNEQVNADMATRKLAQQVSDWVNKDELRELKQVLSNYKDVQSMTRSDDLKNLLKVIAEKTGILKKEELDKLNLSDPQVLAKLVADINNKNSINNWILFWSQISEWEALGMLQWLSKNSNKNWKTPEISTSLSSTITTKKVDPKKPDSNINVLIHTYDWKSDSSPVKIEINNNWTIDSWKIDWLIKWLTSKWYNWKYTESEFIDLLQSMWIKSWFADIIGKLPKDFLKK